MSSDPRQVALEQAVNYHSYRNDRHTTEQTILETADAFYQWLTATTVHPVSTVQLVFDQPSAQ